MRIRSSVKAGDGESPVTCAPQRSEDGPHAALPGARVAPGHAPRAEGRCWDRLRDLPPGHRSRWAQAPPPDWLGTTSRLISRFGLSVTQISSSSFMPSSWLSCHSRSQISKSR